MSEALAKIEEVAARAAAELATVSSPQQLEQFRIRFLGSSGEVKNLMQLLKSAPADQKRAIGQRANAVKDQITSAYEAKKAELARAAAAVGEGIDVTEPGRRPALGNYHIMLKVQDELTELFARMGFAVATGPEVEDEFHNFVALNIPPHHPSRDPLDNFYLVKEMFQERHEGGSDEATERRSDEGGERGNDEARSPKSERMTNGEARMLTGNWQLATGNSCSIENQKSKIENLPASALSTQHSALSTLLLRSQTSTVQIRVMEKQRPPIRVVMPGRVYRPDTVDQTHLFQFHQLEALVVDRNVTMVDLKSTIMQFIHAYFGPTTRARFRPSYFPFTEPSAEVDMWFEGLGRWMEFGGCGMVHPNVLEACGIDPEEYTGWAFGFGIERLAMRKYGIDDIRHFVENDVRFLRQF